jgi:hypothetical protein
MTNNNDLQAAKEKYADLMSVYHDLMLALERAEQLQGEWRQLMQDLNTTDNNIIAATFQPFIDKGIVPGAYFRTENSDKVYKIVQIRKLSYGVIDIADPDKVINATLQLYDGESTIDRFILLPDYKEKK